MRRFAALYAFLLTQTCTTLAAPVFHTRADVDNLVPGASNPVALVDSVTCDIFGIELANPQEALASVSSGALSCNGCTIEMLTFLLEECLAASSANRNSRGAARPQNDALNLGGQSFDTEIENPGPAVYQPFEGSPDPAAQDNVLPTSPPANTDNGNQNQDQPPVPGSPPPENVDDNNSSSNAAPDPSASPSDNGSSGAPAAASQQNDATEQNVNPPTPAPEATNANASASNNGSSGAPAAAPQQNDATQAPSPLAPAPAATNPPPSSPAPASAPARNASPQSAPASPFSGFESFSPLGSATTPQSDTSERYHRPTNSRRPTNTGGCNGIACAAQDFGLPGSNVPNLTGGPSSLLTGAGGPTGLIGGMSNCPSGDIALCLDAATG